MDMSLITQNHIDYITLL